MPTARRYGRRKPYTRQGAARIPCTRCGATPSVHQWQVCADGGLYRPLCLNCDLELQTIMLTFLRDPDTEAKVAAYANR